LHQWKVETTNCSRTDSVREQWWFQLSVCSDLIKHAPEKKPQRETTPMRSGARDWKLERLMLRAHALCKYYLFQTAFGTARNDCNV
jgi:hypothetical protein